MIACLGLGRLSSGDVERWKTHWGQVLHHPSMLALPHLTPPCWASLLGLGPEGLPWSRLALILGLTCPFDLVSSAQGACNFVDPLVHPEEVRALTENGQHCPSTSQYRAGRTPAPGSRLVQQAAGSSTLRAAPCVLASRPTAAFCFPWPFAGPPSPPCVVAAYFSKTSWDQLQDRQKKESCLGGGWYWGLTSTY